MNFEYAQPYSMFEKNLLLLTALRTGDGARIRGEHCMSPWSSLGKIVVVFGLVLVCLGLVLLLVDKVPWLGKLPGDIHIKRDRFSFYFPITTSIIISLLLTLLFTLFRR
jgi:hypothetical protein